MGSYEPKRGAGSRRRGHLVLPLLVACCAQLSGRAGVAGHSVTPATPAPDSIGVLRPPLPAASDPFLADLEERTFRFFWETGNAPTPPFASIKAAAFRASGPSATPGPGSNRMRLPPPPPAPGPPLARPVGPPLLFLFGARKAPRLPL